MLSMRFSDFTITFRSTFHCSFLTYVDAQKSDTMCRFLVYKGKDEILLSKLILEPQHSILTQSYDSRLRMVSPILTKIL